MLILLNITASLQVQGQTLPAVILDLNGGRQGALSVASLYVGISRVRKGDDIRILPIEDATRRYLERMEFDARLQQWWRAHQKT